MSEVRSASSMVTEFFTLSVLWVQLCRRIRHRLLWGSVLLDLLALCLFLETTTLLWRLVSKFNISVSNFSVPFIC